MRATIMLGLSLALLSGSEIAAQDSPVALRPGQVIRVSGAKGFRFTGEFMGRDSSALVIRPSDGQSRRVPLGWISKLEIRTAHKSGAGTGALIGATTGAVLGLAAVAGIDNDEFFDPCCSAGGYASGAVLFGAAAGGLGAVIGALSHKDTWVRVPSKAWQDQDEASTESQDWPVAKSEKKRTHPARP
jgi:hypothetical protein